MVIPCGYAAQVSAEPFPQGMEIAEDGNFYSTPTEPDIWWNIVFKVTDYNGISISKPIEFTASLVSVEELNNAFELDVIISPNPFNSFFDIHISGQSGNYFIQLCDASGRILQTFFEGPVQIGNVLRWQSGGKLMLRPGIYFLNWSNDLQTGTEKIVFVD